MVHAVQRPCPLVLRSMGGHAQSEDDRRCSFELPIHPRYVVQYYLSSTLDRFTVFSDGRIRFFGLVVVVTALGKLL
jgi:hypothetical protein